MENDKNNVGAIGNGVNESENKEKKEASLNILCAICCEFFGNTNIIYSTSKCGHVFHQQCLFRWLSHSKSCPQCRANVFKHTVHRLFLNFREPCEMDEENVEPMNNFEWMYIDNCDYTIEELEEFGFVAYEDSKGVPVYVARVYLEDELLPAYYVPEVNGAYISYNDESHVAVEDIELLNISSDNSEYEWIPAADGELPDNALEIGFCETGEKLYSARAMYEGRMCYGKLQPSHGCAYVVPALGDEVNNRNYEVLVRIPNTN